MNVFELRNQLVDNYKSYISSFIQIRDKRIRSHVDEQLGWAFMARAVDPVESGIPTRSLYR